MKVISILLAFSFLLISCENSGIKKDGRGYIKPLEEGPAVNIQSLYDLKTVDNKLTMTIDLINEDDFANILGVVERSDFSETEKFAFNKNGINMDEVSKYKNNITIGVGPVAKGATPENITVNATSTSKINLKTTDYESLTTATHTVRYSVVGTIEKNSHILKGYMAMTITNNSTQKTESYGMTLNSETSNSPLDYIGDWEGSTTLKDQSAIDALSSFSIAFSGSKTFTIVTKYVNFSHLNENFKLNIVLRNYDELASKESAIISLEFIGEVGTKLNMLGIISKTAFKGDIFQIKAGGIQESIATFNYIKKVN